MMSEYRSKATSRWRQMTSWGLDTISFGSSHVHKSQIKCLSHIGHSPLCNFICLWIDVNTHCPLPALYIRLSMRVCRCSADLPNVWLNLPHIPTCSPWFEESCTSPRRPSRLDSMLYCEKWREKKALGHMFAELVDLPAQKQDSLVLFLRSLLSEKSKSSAELV